MVMSIHCWQKQQEISFSNNETYARISVEKQADVLTRAQGFAKMMEVDLGLGLYNTDDD